LVIMGFSRIQKTHVLIGLSICYLGTILLPLISKSLFDLEATGLKLLRYVGIQSILCFALIYFVLNVEKRTWASIGFVRFNLRRDILWALLGFVLGGLSFAISGPVIAMMDMDTTMDGVLALMEYPVWFRIGIAITAGITEEILFRTYAIERLTEWTGSILIGSILSILLFAGFHIPFWSLGGAIQIGIGTIIWTWIYYKTRSIWPMMIMHVINDLFAFVLLPYLFGHGV